MRALFAVGVLLATAGAMVWTAPTWLVDAIAEAYPGCLYRVPTRERVVALTLDDGPDSISTPVILAELQKHGARATFFLISERMRTQEALVRSIVTEGHELGNHFSHERPRFATHAPRAHTVHSAGVGTAGIRLVYAGDGRCDDTAWVSLRPWISVSVRRRNPLHLLGHSLHPPQCAARGDRCPS